MSAVDTVFRVLEWAASPAGSRGNLPRGDLRGLDALTSPSSKLRGALGRLSAATAARLTLASPPLADVMNAGSAALWLAAAVGAAHEKVALEIAGCCSTVRSASRTPAWELIARHAVVGPAREQVPPTLGESLVGVSPLTALLNVPARGSDDALRLLGERLLERDDGRRLLVNVFSRPPEGPPGDQGPRLAWRGSFLDGLRHSEEHRAFVLDVYEAAIALHRDAWLERTHVAAFILSNPGAPKEQLDFAFAVAGWWEPLRGLHRAHLDWIRERKYMDFHVYLQGIKVAAEGARLSQGLPP